MFALSKEPAKVASKFSKLFKMNVRKIVDHLKSKSEVPKNSLIFLQGTKTIQINDEDMEYWDIHQDSHFYYAFGVQEPDCFGIIDVDQAKQIVFIPRLPEDYKLWMKVYSAEEYQREHLVDEVMYVDELEAYFEKKSPSLVYLNEGVNSDSGLSPNKPSFPFLQKYQNNLTDLFNSITECRVYKSEQEIETMDYITQLSCEAHVEVMQRVKPGMKEYQMRAIFEAYVKNHSNGLLAYPAICCAGVSGSKLHYNDNDQTIKETDMILNDMGGKWRGYCADVTCSFPVSGKFNVQQKQIYEAVLEANRTVIQVIKPGVKYDDMHLLAEKIILTHLQKIGIVKKEFSIEEMQNERVGAVFFPHGLGHFIGLATHDVAGYNVCCPMRLTDDGLNKLRTRRVMEENMVVTVEPGCYFIKFKLDRVKSENRGKYINYDVVEQFMNFGGVRIEDDILITKDGCRNLSKDVPRTVEEIEKCMSGQAWK